MPLAPQPLSLFYRQLAQQLSAGLTLAQALRSNGLAPPHDCARLAQLAEGGESTDLIFQSAGNWLPTRDRPFLRAAATAGRLPHILQNLADRYAQVHTTRIRVLMACAYPLLVFHLGALLFPFLRLINFERGLEWSVAGYLGGLLAILLPFWGTAALLYYLVRIENPPALAFLNLLPAIGGYRRNQALADFAFALGNLLDAGAAIGPAWRDAGEIAHSPRIQTAAAEMQTAILRGAPPGPLLAQTGAFPPEFIARYQTGEMTGSLEKSLLALAADYQARANQRLAAASMLYPGLLFGAVAVMIGYFVISFYAGYFNSINKMIDGM